MIAIRNRLRDEGGFTLLEIVAALSIFAIAAGALLGVLVAGIRTAGVARDRTVAKDLVRDQLEDMRRLPYYVQHAAGTECVPGVKVDLLDIYFPNLSAPAYNSAKSTYTSTFSPVPGFSKFDVEVEARFVDAPLTQVGSFTVLGEVATVTPPATYSCTSSTGDRAPSRVMLATVTARWGPSKDRSFTLRTFLGEARLGGLEIQGSVSGSMLRIDTAFSDSSTLRGEVSTTELNIFAGNNVTSRSDTLAVIGRITQSSGAVSQVTGARKVIGAPPSSGPFTVTDSTGATLTHPVLLGVNAFSFGPNQVSGVEVRGGSGALIANGVTRLRHGLIDDDDSKTVAMSATNEIDPTDPRGFDFTKPFVQTVKVKGVKASSLSSNCTESNVDVKCTAIGEMGELRMIPVNFLPAGNATDGYLVTLLLDSVSLEAKATRTGSGGVATATFDGVLRYWEYLPLDLPPKHVLRTVTIANGVSALPADSTLSSICVKPGPLGLGCAFHLSDYILTWSARSSGRTAKSGDNRTAEAALEGIVRITTRPTSTILPNSGFIIRAGEVLLRAVDNR